LARAGQTKTPSPLAGAGQTKTLSPPAGEGRGEGEKAERAARGTRHKTRPAIVSIHDITPDTLCQTLDIVELLQKQNVGPATLLVIPDADWSEGDLDVLRQLQASGHELAGHGWTHRCAGIRSWSHRMHSLLISRDLGEHLSLDADRIAALVARNHQWFADAGFDPPSLYVPPAWGMGPIRRRGLRALPFTMYEYLTGVYPAPTDTFTRLPLLGFEADTRWRRHTLRALNAFNSTAGRLLDKPLRIAIHPFDLSYHLAEDLRALLAAPLRLIRYSEIDFGRRKTRAPGAPVSG
jgi:hypothetical protein